MNGPALLAFADGTLLHGRSVGAVASSSGELVFNTAMSGYQEILSDPSYARQIISFSCPHIGNIGVNEEDLQSAGVYAAGVVLRDLSPCIAGPRGRLSLSSFLADHGIPAIAGLDTRQLVRRLREEGALHACLDATQAPDEQRALEQARAFPGISGMDLAREYSCPAPYAWEEGEWRATGGFAPASGTPRFRVVVYDFGVKRDILRRLVSQGAEVRVVPAITPAAEVLALRPDGVLLSNGPGDPEPCQYAIQAIRELLASGTPLFGICLGFQLLALACGARTLKMKFGHHGANHPVQELDSRRVLVTSQNHGFMVDAESLPDCLRPTHHSLFDGSLQGFHHREKPAFGIQGHPEAGPGPQDAVALFEHFAALMEAQRQGDGDAAPH